MPEQVILCGVRAYEPGEREYVEQAGLRSYGVDEIERVLDGLDGLDGPVYVHVDLDVLEPTEFGSTCFPVPRGIPPARLIEVISRLDNVVGAAITEHAPLDAANAAEAEVLRQLGAALSS